MTWVTLCATLATGALASILATFITNAVIGHRINKRYRVTEGSYSGYGFVDDDANPLVQRADEQSKAEITHVRGNVLHLSVCHGGRRWDGDLAMETDTYGTVVWRYSDLPDDVHSFGFKRIMVRIGTDRVLLYVLGEKPFGKEIFVRPNERGSRGSPRMRLRLKNVRRALLRSGYFEAKVE